MSRISAIERIGIDPHSTVGSRLRRDLIELEARGELTVEALAVAVTIAVARLEACIFGGLDDPTIDRVGGSSAP
jgi:hypothetical protein